MIYLLDTNIISELRKPIPNDIVVTKLNTYRTQCSISSITWFEILDGMYKMPNGIRKDTMRSYILILLRIVISSLRLIRDVQKFLQRFLHIFDLLAKHRHTVTHKLLLSL